MPRSGWISNVCELGYVQRNDGSRLGLDPFAGVNDNKLCMGPSDSRVSVEGLDQTRLKCWISRSGEVSRVLERQASGCIKLEPTAWANVPVRPPVNEGPPPSGSLGSRPLDDLAL